MKRGLDKRIVITLIALMVLMAVIISVISARAMSWIYYRQYSIKGQDLVRMLSDRLDGDWVGEFAETLDTDDERYEQTKALLDSIKNDFTGVQYLYIFEPGDKSLTYLVEGQSESDDPENISVPGDVYGYVDTDYKRLVPDIKAQRASEGIIRGEDAGYGVPIMSWAPIFDSEGKMVAMVEADYIIENIGRDINGMVTCIVLIQLLLIAVVVALLIARIRSIVVRPLMELTGVVDSYKSGEPIEDISRFNTGDEINSLAYSFKDMTERIERYIDDLTRVTAEKERISAELNVATQIQADMLPRIFPPFPDKKEFDLYASMEPAKEVGGDFYDFFMIDDDHLGLVMADVSGKGVPAALFMVIAKTMIKNRALTGGYSGPGEVLQDVNNQLCEGNEAELFVTVWFGILTISTGDITFASAGHEYPAFCRNETGFALEKDKHGPPLATMEGLRFKDNVTRLEVGETLYLYTDGVTEATNKDMELFGESRMIEALSAHSGDELKDLLKDVRADIDAFVGDAPQFDDLTMLAVRYFGREKTDE